NVDVAHRVEGNRARTIEEGCAQLPSRPIKEPHAASSGERGRSSGYNFSDSVVELIGDIHGPCCIDSDAGWAGKLGVCTCAVGVTRCAISGNEAGRAVRKYFPNSLAVGIGDIDGSSAIHEHPYWVKKLGGTRGAAGAVVIAAGAIARKSRG